MTDSAQEKYIEIADGGQSIRLSGAWTVFHADAIRAHLRHDKKTLQQAVESKSLRVDMQNVDRLDTVGAWLIRRYFGASRDGWSMTEQQQKLLAFLPDNPQRPHATGRGYQEILARIGRKAADLLAFAFDIVAFSGMIFLRLMRNVARPGDWRIAAITRHIYETGIAALPIIGLLAFLMSMVVSYQGALQLQKFGADIFTIDLTVISMLREMAPLVTAIMVAGRSGSAFAAEIGVMRLRRETDALEAMGLDPVTLLVVPRLLALLITLPLLSFFADMVGIAGGALMSWSLLDIGLGQYFDRVAEVATVQTYLVGLCKAPVFAVIISIICTYQGINVTGSAENVGRVTTVAVVQSIFMVIFADAAFSILFADLGI